MENDDMRSALAKWLAGLDGRRQNKRNIAGLLEVAFQRIDALKARVEAAEAEVVDLHRQLAEKGTAMEEIEYECLALAARVAELEATLAAQQWRPMTEEPEADDEYLVWCSSYAGCEIQSYSRRLNRWYGNTGNDADYWQPLSPAPQEPTQ